MRKINVVASCEIIKQKCEELKITPKQLQEQLNVTVTAPYIWLNGKGIPKIETLINLAEMLHCEPMDLLVVEGDGCVESTLLGQTYYNKEGRKECWEEMRDIDEIGTAIFDLWNAYKYIYRAGDKANNSKENDLKKAQNYIEHAQMIKDANIFSEDEERMYNAMKNILNEIQK